VGDGMCGLTGMMGTIPSDVRSGLLELFYGVYQKDPDRCIDALITMGVLVPGGDRMAIRRTAEFFLKNFQVRCPHHQRNLPLKSLQALFLEDHALGMEWRKTYWRWHAV